VENGQGCLFASLAMANAGAGIIHALGYPLSSGFGMPHGLANALVAAAALERSWHGRPERYAELARMLGGDEAADLAARVRQLLADAGGATRWRVGEWAKAICPRGRRAQLLLGHVDTVWPLGTIARLPVTLRDGRLTGPGVYDMKGGLTQIVFALAALRELGLEAPATPVVFVSSDEEVFSTDSRRAISRLARRVERVFVMEPSLGPEGRLKTRRKGFGRFVVSVHGKAAHSGLDPEKGASAILEMAHAILYLHSLSDPARGIAINVGTVHGGERANVIAPEATAEVGVRLLAAADRGEIESKIAALRPVVPGTRIEIAGKVDHPPLERTPRNQALFALARAAAGDLGIELEEGMAGGGSDGNTTSLFTATLDGLGAVGDGAHADHEFVEVDRLPERAALLAMLMLAPLAAGEPPLP